MWSQTPLNVVSKICINTTNSTLGLSLSLNIYKSKHLWMLWNLNEDCVFMLVLLLKALGVHIRSSLCTTAVALQAQAYAYCRPTWSPITAFLCPQTRRSWLKNNLQLVPQLHLCIEWPKQSLHTTVKPFPAMIYTSRAIQELYYNALLLSNTVV